MTTQTTQRRNLTTGQVFYGIGQGLLLVLLLGTFSGGGTVDFAIFLAVSSVALSGFYLSMRRAAPPL